MKWFPLLVGVCLLLADNAAGISTVAIGRVPGVCLPPAQAEGCWVVLDAERHGTCGFGVGFGASRLQAEVYVQPACETADDDVPCGGMLWRNRVFHGNGRRDLWSYNAAHGGGPFGGGAPDVHEAVFGKGRSEWTETFEASVCCLDGEGDALVCRLSPARGPQGGTRDEGEASLLRQFLGTASNAGWMAIEKPWVLTKPPAPRGKLSLPVSRQDMLGLVAPGPGAVVLGSLGLGLLGWLRKRSVR